MEAYHMVIGVRNSIRKANSMGSGVLLDLSRLLVSAFHFWYGRHDEALGQRRVPQGIPLGGGSDLLDYLRQLLNQAFEKVSAHCEPALILRLRWRFLLPVQSQCVQERNCALRFQVGVQNEALRFAEILKAAFTVSRS